MPTLIAGVVAVVVLYLLLQMFRAANPAVLARAIKIVGGVVALAVAAYTGLRGELAVAIPLGIFGAGLLGWSPFGATGFPQYRRAVRRRAQRSSGQSSRVRSQFLDMSLDHDSGELSGTIVAGDHAGRRSTSSICRSCWRWCPASTPRASPYLKAILTAGFPPGVRTRRATGQGGSAARRRAAK